MKKIYLWILVFTLLTAGCATTQTKKSKETKDSSATMHGNWGKDETYRL
jgi:PBP1b-binding outer membrane lipoprotein LpoB